MIFDLEPEKKINTRELFAEIKTSLGSRAKDIEISVLHEPHTRTITAPNGTDEVFYYGYKIQITGVEAEPLEITSILNNHRPQKSTLEEKQEKAAERSAISRKEFEEFKASVTERLLNLERG